MSRTRSSSRNRIAAWIAVAVTFVAVSFATGSLRLSYTSAPCTGAMTFLVSGAEAPGKTFDRTVGKLQQWMLPE